MSHHWYCTQDILTIDLKFEAKQNKTKCNTLSALGTMLKVK